MAQLTFYYMDGCPYCQKVLRFMQQNIITLALKNTLSDPKNRQELLKIGGKTQVPCLVIDGKALYESDDIIQWLKRNYQR
ncbi:MAG: glutaredoxin [Omnitrophica WOR_2 bacterium RIFCSPHIGHO2_01_FULL_48_9]|nr:MAG: glutaredoxin [Omnitrophica WOR_2 bacterium RIFCSPHIGHO2_02_FULL_48_11]OGX30496.1 MAG: glutaredoxin [Omnitrophica WOR_2 bacterium RIFCSPHIGHO2_01_FULL_48_9]